MSRLLKILGLDRIVVTKYDPPPIPIRNHDWTATFEDYDLGDPTGTGATEQDAVNDLIEQVTT
jgi:hypothetical protein